MRLRATKLSAISGVSRKVLPVLNRLSASPTFALSLRRVLQQYAGPCLRVRRSSDNTESDIMFASDGAVDTSALLGFVGSGSGYVVSLYDQMGVANAVQLTTSAQPLIVSSGVLVQQGTKPAIAFSGAQFLRVNTTITGTAFSLNAISRIDPTSAAWAGIVSLGSILTGADNDAFGKFVWGRSSTTAVWDVRSVNKFFTSNPGGYVQCSGTLRFSGANGAARINGVPNGSNSAMNLNISSTFTTIGARDGGLGVVNGFLTGNIQEVFAWANTSITDSDAQILERDQGVYFGISVI